MASGDLVWTAFVGNKSNEPGWLRDGNLNFQGGVNSGLPPSDLPRDQVAFAINATFRGGPAKPRPGWKRLPLVFLNGCKTAFESGFFQEGLPYEGDTSSSLLSSHGGRQFRIDLDAPPAPLATTSADFTVPALNGSVAVTVDDTSNLYANTDQITFAGTYTLTLLSIDSTTQVTVKNLNTANAGSSIASGSSVMFLGTLETTEITPTKTKTTVTTADFTIPAVGSTVDVSAQDVTGMVTQYPLIDIGGYTLSVVSVNSPTSFTVMNQESSAVSTVVSAQTTVTFQTQDSNNPNNKLNWSIQAENYWILQDNFSDAVIFDGSKAFRASEQKKQVPVGNVMCYAMGRLCVALPDRQTYRVGDLVFGQSGTAEHDYRDAILYFTENDVVNEGGDFIARVFGAPSDSGNILAMKAAAMTDTSLGQGPMLVGTPNVVFSVNLPFDRTTWKNLANPLQTTNPIIGPTGQRSTVIVNTDIWYRSLDGIRSYITAQRQFNGSWGNTPKSFEVKDLLAHDTEALLEYGSAVLFDNRLLFTTSPQQTSRGIYHRGLAVLDFNLTSSLRTELPPAWEGVWTGLRILKIVRMVHNGKERCFLYVMSDSSAVELWELTKDEKADTTAAGETPIVWEVQTPGYNCTDLDQLKKIETARMIFTGLSGSVSVVIQFRSDESACWNDWYTQSLCSKSKDCDTHADCAGPITYREQPRYAVRLPMPPDDFDPINHRKKTTGYEFQLRFQITGYAELRQCRIFCLDEPENLGLERTDAT